MKQQVPKLSANQPETTQTAPAVADHPAEAAVSEQDSIFYGLDEPPHHHIVDGALARFCGSVLCIHSRAVCALTVTDEEGFRADFPVDRPTPLIGAAVPHIRKSGSCGFEFDLMIARGSDHYDFELVFESGAREFFFRYDISPLRAQASKLAAMREAIEQLAMPDGPTVFLTQGHENVVSYKNSIIPFIINVERYLAEVGVDIRDIRSVLDIGCGSGRALTAWYLDDASRNLHGCDINPELVAWSHRHLPREIAIVRSLPLPPLAYPDSHFDLVQLISVFTHLSLGAQQAWVREIRRILKPGAYLLITFQQAFYVEIFLPDSLDQFRRAGYLETSGQAEGLNSYGTYHTPSRVREMFSGFDLVAYFPRGKIRGKRTVFQIASQQDVYLLRRSS